MPMPTLYAAYEFSSNLNDSSGNALTLGINQGTPVYAAGLLGNSVSRTANGVLRLNRAANNTQLGAVTGGRSYSVWLKLSADANTVSIIRRRTGFFDMEIQIQPANNRVQWYWNHGGSNIFQNTLLTFAGVWSLFTFVYDPATANKGCLYQNGFLMQTDTNITLTDISGGASPLFDLLLSGDGSATTMIADSLFVSGVLDIDQIKFLYNNGAGRLFTDWSLYGTLAPAQIIPAPYAQNGTTLYWSRPANNGSALTGYKLYRSTTENGVYTLLQTIAAGTETANDFTGTPGTTYWYKVAATNLNGEGTLSGGSSAVAVNVPTAVRNLRATWVQLDDDSYEIRAFWDAPLEGNEDGNLVYNVGYISNPNEEYDNTGWDGGFSGTDYAVQFALSSYPNAHAWKVLIGASNGRGFVETSCIASRYSPEEQKPYSFNSYNFGF